MILDTNLEMNHSFLSVRLLVAETLQNDGICAFTVHGDLAIGTSN